MNNVKRKLSFKFIIWSVVLMLSFGGNVYFDLPDVTAETIVYVTRTGEKYHTHKCGNGTYYAATLSEAKSRGLTPCSKCFGNNSSYSDSSASSSSSSSKKIVSKPIKINKSSVILVKGQRFNLKIKNAQKQVEWKTSNKSVVSVSSSGKLLAKEKGKALISATVGNETKKCKVIVENPKLNIVSMNMDIGEKRAITLLGCKHYVRWSSTNPYIAKINNGKIVAKNVGKTVITARVHGKKYKCKISVNKPEVNMVTLAKSPAKLGYNKKIKIKVNTEPKNALECYEIFAKSSDTDIVQVSVDGNSIILKSFEKAGKVNISITVGTITEGYQFEVIPSVITAFNLPSETITLRPNDTKEVCFEVIPNDAISYYDSVWKSSDENVVVVEKKGAAGTRYGNIKAVGEGEVDVTVSLGDKTAICHVVVKKPEIAELTLDRTELTLKPNGTASLYLTVNPSVATNYYDVVWKSSDEKVVKVEKRGETGTRYGDIKAVGEGEADVTVSLGDKTAICRVVVSK